MKLVHNQTAILIYQLFEFVNKLICHNRCSSTPLFIINVFSTIFKLHISLCYFIPWYHIIVNRNNFLVGVVGCFIFSNIKLSNEGLRWTFGRIGNCQIHVKPHQHNQTIELGQAPLRLVLFICTSFSCKSVSFETKNFCWSYRQVVTLLSENTFYFQTSTTLFDFYFAIFQ